VVVEVLVDGDEIAVVELGDVASGDVGDFDVDVLVEALDLHFLLEVHALRVAFEAVNELVVFVVCFVDLVEQDQTADVGDEGDEYEAVGEEIEAEVHDAVDAEEVEHDQQDCADDFGRRTAVCCVVREEVQRAVILERAKTLVLDHV